MILCAFSFANPATTALAAPPAPMSKTLESLQLWFRCFIGSRNPSMSVLYPLNFPFSLLTVFVAPIVLQSSSISSRNFIISILCGIVTLNPAMLISFKESIPSANSPFGILYAIYVQSNPRKAKAALCIAGESE